MHRVATWMRATMCAGPVLIVAGCANTMNHFHEDGPAVTAAWQSPTEIEMRARYQPASVRQREWAAKTIAPQDGGVRHWPLYFEDPFVDKGHGRTDETHYHNVWRGGWEDPFAAVYDYARFTANWLFVPVSAAVTPPWTIMESDGFVSRQLLWYDHDARVIGSTLFAREAPAGTPEPTPAEVVPAVEEQPEPEDGQAV